MNELERFFYGIIVVATCVMVSKNESQIKEVTDDIRETSRKMDDKFWKKLHETRQAIEESRIRIDKRLDEIKQDQERMMTIINMNLKKLDGEFKP